MFVLYVNKSLGVIREVKIGHNNFGDSPSWFLEEIFIRDVQSNQSCKFVVSQWFALERGDGRIERMFQATVSQMDFASEVAKRWRRGLMSYISGCQLLPNQREVTFQDYSGFLAAFQCF